MYTVSAAHWAISIALLVRAARSSPFVGIVMTPVEELADTYLPVITSILGDTIVVWRAWVLWERRRDLFVPPVLFLLATIVVSVASAALTFKGTSSDRQQEIDISYRLQYPIYGLSILTNLWATSLICIRAWQHRRLLQSLMGKSTPRTRAEKVLAFLIESGAIYLCIWVKFAIVNSTSVGWVFILNGVDYQLVGIYPTFIVVVVTMRLSTADVLSQHSGSEKPASSTPIVVTSRSLQPESFDGSISDTSDITSPHGGVPSQVHAATFIVK
ncbi:hypothetical protein BC834DRAFT_1039460 [Gloeopeniophorella convolvens]|nr:hypothetical protein BC834DRAFT_1039460 [Gloeopeniophorella convolvens]